MKIIQTKVFEFAELNDKAKEKAREWLRRANDGDTYFSESVIEDAETCAGFIGITFARKDVQLMGGGKRQDPTVYFSGFSSQGDGACFEGGWSARDVKPGALKEHAPQDSKLHRIAAEFERIAKEYPQASFSVKHHGHYSHSRCTDFTVDMTGDCETAMSETGEAGATKSEKDLIEAARAFMNWIYNGLQKKWEYQNSDEQIDESITANGYTFTETGKRFG